MPKRRPGSSLRCANWRVRKNNNPVQGWNFGKEGEAAMKKIIQMLFLMLIFAVFFCVYAAAEEDPLFIVQEGWKQGVINKAGEWVVEPIYERIWPFTDAGYAVVEPDEVFESEEVDIYNHFMLIDRQGNIVADLPEWRLCNYYGPNSTEERLNAAGSAFILISMETEDSCCVLYLADAGKMIMLDREFLGCVLSPEAEKYVRQYQKWELYPSDFVLAEWKDRMVLGFIYYDYVESSSDKQAFDEILNVGFIIMDRQGNKVHDGCFAAEPEGLIPLDEMGFATEHKYIIESSRLLLNYSIIGNADSPWSLIDRNGKVILQDLPSSSEWDEGLQAVRLGKEGAVLLNGEQISEDEYRKRRAALNPCGIVMDDYKYYDAQGDLIEWPELGNYMAVSEFGTDGLAWVELDGVSCLVNVNGQVVTSDVSPAQDYQYVRNFYQYRIPLFLNGWECVFDDKNYRYGYMNPAGEMMYGGFAFDRAEAFRNGAAYVQIMDGNYSLLNACIDTDGRVIWAENGKKDEVQHQLDGGILYRIENMSLEEARQALVGEWDGGGGEYIHFPMFFYEDGTCSDAFETKQWTLLENTWGKDAFNGAPFVLVFGETDISEKPEDGYEVWFSNRDSFVADSKDGRMFISRVSPGYWERSWQKYDSWRQSVHPEETEEPDERDIKEGRN